MVKGLQALCLAALVLNICLSAFALPLATKGEHTSLDGKKWLEGTDMNS